MAGWKSQVRAEATVHSGDFFLFQGSLSSALKASQEIESGPSRLPKILWILITSVKYLHTPSLVFDL